MTATYQSHLSLARLPAAEAAGPGHPWRRHPPGRNRHRHAQTAFTDGMHLALLIAAGIVAATAITVAVLLRQGAPLTRR